MVLKAYIYLTYKKLIAIKDGVRKKMKQDQVNELKTYYTPELKKVGNVETLTKLNYARDPDDLSGPATG
jgi:hypothetical protein